MCGAKQQRAAGVVQHTRGGARELARAIVRHSANDTCTGIVNGKAAGHDAVRGGGLVIAAEHEAVLGLGHHGTLARAAGVRRARAMAQADQGANVGQRLERHDHRAREVRHRPTAPARELARAIVGNRVALALRPVVDKQHARLRQRRALDYVVQAEVFLLHFDALGVRRDAHLDAARRLGQHDGAPRRGPLVYADGLGTVVGHDLRVDALGLDPGVGDLRCGRQAACAVEQAAVVIDRLAHHRFLRIACKEPGRRRSRKVVKQCIKQLACRNLRLEINQCAVDDLREGARLRVHALDAHALVALTRLAFHVHQHIGLTNSGWRHAGPLQELACLHGLVVVLQQVAIPLAARRHAAFDTLRDLLACGEGVFEREHGDAHARVSGRLRDDHVGAIQRRLVGIAQHTEDRIDLHAPHGARLLGNVREDFVAAPAGQQLRGRRAAALGHVGHVGRARKTDVACKQWHHTSRNLNKGT